MAKVLTTQVVRKLKCNSALPREVPDAGSPGLYLTIRPSGKKSWDSRFRRPDRRTAKLTLGSVNLTGDGKGDDEPVIGGHHTLAAARKLNAAVRHQIAQGKDPAAIHQAKKQAAALSADNTFGLAACDFISMYAKKRTRRWQPQGRLLGLQEADGNLEFIERGLAWRWRDTPIAEVDADAVFRVIEEVRHKGVPGLVRKNAEASEPRTRIMYATLSKMFNWLVEKRRVKANPMANLRRPALSAARDRVLSEREIGALWQATTDIPKVFAAVIRLLVLTGCRRDEVSGMQVKELSDDGLVWTIPSRRTKNKRVHVVPLPPLARAIIAGVERLPECPYVFSTTGKTAVSGFSKIKARLDSKMKDAAPAPWVIHDLRRTIATGMAEIGIQPHIIEAVLNHVSGAKAGVAGIYNRAEYAKEKREALERWAEHVISVVGNQ